ncbi:MAG: UDP-2,4-diacetamido-2,4,6-trideoxy-beta-L-altropyranose hydrolase [Gammaproteobacteria bacterium]|jgi:UDP-2,4-diacetamido-2,4,6-trideoxy-beta-L-altropyranose hydrolase|nr:UDP-2,4-diacetamido-2,4,6-trideoxy-beta-L-altropyranose hydrolase [Gammaproteobacteria bacterium]
MRVALRADASEDIGTGHIMRCLALADELRAGGAQCLFVCRELPGHLVGRITQQGFAVNVLPLAGSYRTPRGPSDYRGWAQVSAAQDADEFVAAVQSADVVVIDHYGFGLAWERRVRAALPAPLLAIDDLCREHSVEYLLDQNFGRSGADYAASLVHRPDGETLTGPRYALLRREFREQRARLARPAEPPAVHNLLVTLGGVDKPNITAAVVAALQAADLDWVAEVTVLLPRSAPHYARVEALLAGKPGYRLLGAASQMAELMATATLCVGAVGGTAWERAALGLPTVLVPVADNQQAAARELAAADIGLLLDPHDIADQLESRLIAARDRWSALVSASLQLCDARGAVRVARRLLSAAPLNSL